MAKLETKVSVKVSITNNSDLSQDKFINYAINEIMNSDPINTPIDKIEMIQDDGDCYLIETKITHNEISIKAKSISDE